MVNPSAPPGKSQRYARPERERRWLPRSCPDLAAAVAEVAITDRYFPGTRLRLRRSEDRRGRAPTVYKLTQKVPAAAGDPGLITNVYLTEAEFDLLSRLDGDVLTKRRYSVPPYGVDVFGPPLEGLVLAEAEFSTGDGAATFASPPWALAEVTDDPRFAGARLARSSRQEVAADLATFGLTLGDRRAGG